MYRLSLLFFIAILVFACNKNDTPKPDQSGLYVKFFGGALDDKGFSITPSGDGGFYVVGSTVLVGHSDTSVMVIKINEIGNKIWERSYPLNEKTDEIGKDVIVDAQGNIVVAGYKKSSASWDFLVIKINKDNPDDYKEYVFGDSLKDEKASRLFQDTDGNFLIYGNCVNKDVSAQPWDMCVLKTDLTDTIWQRKRGLADLNDDLGCLKKIDNGLIWFGTVTKSLGRDMRLVSTDDFGNIRWDYGFDENDSTDQTGHDLQVLSDGYILAGSQNTKGGDKDIFLVRTDKNGNRSLSYKSEIVLNLKGDQEAYSIAATDNEYVVTGYSLDNTNKEIFVAKVNSDGNIIGTPVTFGGPGDDTGMKILKISGGYIVVGTVEAANNSMIAVYKLNEKLELIP